MNEPIRIRARSKDGLTEILLLMPHPMETGLRKDAAGSFVPAHFITEVSVAIEGRAVLEARLSQAVSQDPLLSLRVRGGKPGDRISVCWTDSRGDARSNQALIAA